MDLVTSAYELSTMFSRDAETWGSGWDISASGNEIRSNEIIDYIKGYGSIEIVKVSPSISAGTILVPEAELSVSKTSMR